MEFSRNEIVVLIAAAAFGVVQGIRYWRRRPRVVEVYREGGAARTNAQPERAAERSAPPVDATSDEEYAADFVAVPQWDLDAPERPAVEDTVGAIWFRCGCCDYPVFPDGFLPRYTTCPICDYEDARRDSDGFVEAASEQRKTDVDARNRFLQFGSVISPEERAEFDGALSDEEVRLRLEARRVFDYVLGGERPDASERWEEATGLLEAIRDAERRRLDAKQRDDDRGTRRAPPSR